MGNADELDSSLTARAGIGLEKFQTSFKLLGASLFYGTILALYLLLPLELPEVSDLSNKASLLYSAADGGLSKIERLT